MTDDHTAPLIDKAAELYGIKIRCTHNHVTLCQHIDAEFGWFVTYQCNDCGNITRREVTADDLDGADTLPWLDEDMYDKATTERAPGETLGRALAFFGKAAK